MNTRLKAKIIEKCGHQWSFAQLLGIHESEVSRVLRGQRKLSAAERDRWAAALGTRPSELFRKEDK
jgi:plasmid maintenance system antidote protein VapI